LVALACSLQDRQVGKKFVRSDDKEEKVFPISVLLLLLSLVRALSVANETLLQNEAVIRWKMT